MSTLLTLTLLPTVFLVLAYFRVLMEQQFRDMTRHEDDGIEHEYEMDELKFGLLFAFGLFLAVGMTISVILTYYSLALG